jgi:hypothetical protein
VDDCRSLRRPIESRPLRPLCSLAPSSPSHFACASYSTVAAPQGLLSAAPRCPRCAPSLSLISSSRNLVDSLSPTSPLVDPPSTLFHLLHPPFTLLSTCHALPERLRRDPTHPRTTLARRHPEGGVRPALCVPGTAGGSVYGECVNSAFDCAVLPFSSSSSSLLPLPPLRSPLLLLIGSYTYVADLSLP